MKENELLETKLNSVTLEMKSDSDWKQCLPQKHTHAHCNLVRKTRPSYRPSFWRLKSHFVIYIYIFFNKTNEQATPKFSHDYTGEQKEEENEEQKHKHY